MRRYYVTVHGGGDGLLLPANADKILQEQAVGNLRPLRIETGFDYAGMEIRGTRVNAAPGLSIAGVRQRIPENVASETRIIVSQQPVEDAGPPDGAYGLVLTVSHGDAFSWNGGFSTLAADIRVTKPLAGTQLSAVVLDVFQELMLANCASIQSVLAKFTKLGGTASDFYRAKAEFAMQLIASGEAATLFDGYAPDRYACFSTLARTDLTPVMDRPERERFAQLWRRFLEARFADSFLNVDEAVALIRAGGFHRARPEKTAGSGVRPGARVRYGWIKEHKLREVLDDPQTVLHDGSYVLCVLTGKPKNGDVGKVGTLFGWRSSLRNVPKRLRLCTDRNYAKMIPLVRKGLVTPMRLFLKAR